MKSKIFSAREFFSKLRKETLMDEMAGVSFDRTGIEGLIIFASIASNPHSMSPRIKVFRKNPGKTLSITINDKPQVIAPKLDTVDKLSKGLKAVDISPDELKQVARWIVINKDVLAGYWMGKYMITDEFLNLLKKVDSQYSGINLEDLKFSKNKKEK